MTDSGETATEHAAKCLSQGRRAAGYKARLTTLVNALRDAIAANNDQATLLALRDDIETAKEAAIDAIYDHCDSLLQADRKNDISRKELDIAAIEEKVERAAEELHLHLKPSKTVSHPISSSEDKLRDIERLSLESFSGREDYFHWRAVFDVCIHQRRLVNDQTKMLRLLSCLVGEPKQILSSYPPTADSYESALSRLDAEYGGEKRLLRQTVSRVRDGKVVHGDNLKELREFLSVVESAMINMTKHGLIGELDGGTLFQCAKDRLHKNLLKHFLRWMVDNGREDNFETLKRFLEQEIRVLSEMNICQFSTDDSKKRENCSKKVFSSFSKKTNKTESLNPKQKPLCILHADQSERHYLDECLLFKNMSADERIKICEQKKLCRLCLKTNHLAKDCRSNSSKRCGVNDCNMMHHSLIHRENESVSSDASVRSSRVMRSRESQNGYIALQTVSAYVTCGTKKVHVNVFFDAGSNASFINEDLVDFLNVKKGPPISRQIEMLNGVTQTLNTHRVNVELESYSGDFKGKLPFYTSSSVTGDTPVFDWNQVKDKWPHLRKIKFSELATKRPKYDILIGTDLAFLHTSQRDVSAGIDSPIARLTVLGWTAMGPTNSDGTALKSMSALRMNVVPVGEQQYNFEHDVKQLWELDVVGMLPCNENKSDRKMTTDELTAMNMLNEKLNFVGGRYEAPILWKNGCPTLTTNRAIALRRSANLERSLARTPEVCEKYSNIITDYEQKGYINKVAGEDTDQNQYWYSPHFPVVKQDQGESKVRIVFDCSAVHDGKSLNSQILSGPKLQNDIVRVLLRFRRYAVAIAGDISEMYLQIGLAESDRRYCRFTWRGEDFEWKRQLFGKTDSPFIALHVIREHALKFKDKYPSASTTVIHSMYVDDALDSCPTHEEAVILQKELYELFHEAGMVMRKWSTNSKEVLSQIPSHLRVKQLGLTLSTGAVHPRPALGLMWDTDSDTLKYKLAEGIPVVSKVWTKRNVLQMLSKLFDPLGLMNPFVITAKIMFQKIWTYGLDWDEPLPEELVSTWTRWVYDFPSLSEISVPRELGLPEFGKVELHIFSDASKEAYAAVAYVRVLKNNELTTNIVMARARVTPLKAHSIPRLELMGATIALRMAQFICQSFKCCIEDATFWTDSVNVLYWLKRPSKQFSAFVANRSGEIQQHTNSEQWRYCPTKENPADLATRGLTVSQLSCRTLWWNGPSFLKEHEEAWPSRKVSPEPHPDSTEISKNFIKISTFAVIQMQPEFVLHPSRWSEWSRLRRRTAFVLRFLHNCRVSSDQRHSSVLSNSELRNADIVLMKLSQLEAYKDELDALASNQAIKRSSSLKFMNPFIDDDGLLRARTRLECVEWLPNDTKFPIILPKKHSVTRLIVQGVHQRIGHPVGMNATISEITKKFCIPHVREVVRRQIRQCPTCKMSSAKKTEQLMAPIPNFRLSKPLRAFAKVGIDFCGPFHTKAGRGKPRNKRYICLFTCLQSRAVHLEMTFSLDTDSFLSAFSRMTDRRGIPSEVVSDNGGSFVRAEWELRSMVQGLDQKRIQEQTGYGWKGVSDITWHFNPPASPHFGGIFERMIKSAKRAMNCILKEADINDEELMTTITGVEALCNSRPLTPPSTDINDPQPLTPNHFLHGMVGGDLCPDESYDVSHPIRRWRIISRLLKLFWRRWQKELLPLLQPRQRWYDKRLDIKEDSVVIVVDPDSPRGQWKVGRVVKVYPGVDGKVRVVDVMYKGNIYRRSVCRLCPVEFESVE